MRNSILIKTLEAFSIKELEDISHFLECAYFNATKYHKQNVVLYEFLKQKIKDKDLEELDKKWISQKLYGTNKKDNFRYLENRMSELLSIVRKFILYQEISNSWGKVFEEIICSQFYKSRGLISLQERTLLKAKRIAENSSFYDEKNPLIYYWLDHSIFKLKNLSNKRKGDLHLSSTIKSLSIFFANKLLELNLVQSQQTRVDPKFTPAWKSMINEMTQIFKKNNFWGNPALFLQYKALILLENLNNSNLNEFQNFLSLLNQHEHRIPIETMKNLALYARTYVVKKSNTGYLEFNDLRFEIYKEHLERGWLYEDGKLISSTFFNIIHIASWSNKISWIKYFILNYNSKLLSKNREKIMCYGLALFCCYDFKIKEARTHLNKLLKTKKFADMDFERHCKILELKILYEENEEFILTQLHNFLMFMRRSEKIYQGNIRNLYLRFIKIFKKMIKLRERIAVDKVTVKVGLSKIEEIKQNLEHPTFPIAERLWLLQKTNELKENIKNGRVGKKRY